MKKILYLYHTSSIGGGSYCLLNILRELDKTKYLPTVILRNNGPLVNELKAMGITVYFLPQMRTVPYNCSAFTPSKIIDISFIIRSLKKFSHLLYLIDPDIVYINTMMLYPYLHTAKKHKKKTIIHIREHWAENTHRIQRGIAKSNIIKYADRIIAINSYSASMFCDAKMKPTIVYDWIDLSSRYQKISLNQIFKEDTSGLKVFMYIGGMQKIKGALQVFSTFYNIKRSDYRLLALGLDQNVKTSYIRRMIKWILKKTGFPTYSDKVLNLIHQDSRIKCIPSTYYIKDLYDQVYCVISYFTIPHANLSLAESIIEQTANFAARNPESLEYSKNEKLAILFKENDINDFRNKFINIESYYSILKSSLKTDSYYIRNMFNKDNNIQNLNQVYESI